MNLFIEEEVCRGGRGLVCEFVKSLLQNVDNHKILNIECKNDLEMHFIGANRYGAFTFWLCRYS